MPSCSYTFRLETSIVRKASSLLIPVPVEPPLVASSALSGGSTFITNALDV